MSKFTEEQLAEWDKKHFIHPTSSIQDQQANGPKLIIEKGEGIYLTDIKGDVYIDAMSSLWNVNIGHGNKELAQVAKDQIEKLEYSSTFSTFSHEPAILLAKKIAELAPPSLNAVFFTSGGSESNDSAFKIVRHYWRIQGQPERNKIISLKRGYHGVASASTNATGIPQFWEMAGKTDSDLFVNAETPYWEGTKASIDSIRKVIETEGPETIAAFIAEPIQGAGGVLVPPSDYFKEVRKICDEFGIIFIADEVICGFGRTGKWFGIENYGVEPDMMCFAKGVSSGYIPLGGVLISDKMHDVLKEKSEGTLFHGFTYSGHTTAAAVSLRNIELMEEQGLVENSLKMGEVFLEGFKKIKSKSNIVGDVRMVGLLGAVELVKDPETNERFDPSQKVSPQVIEELHNRGVICRAVVYDGTDIICFSPPLIITEEQVQDVLVKLEESIAVVEERLEL